MSDLVPYALRLEAELLDRLRAEAERREMTATDAIREAVTAWLDRDGMTKRQRKAIAAAVSRFIVDEL